MSHLSLPNSDGFMDNRMTNMAAFGDANVAMFLSDGEGRYVEVNEAFTRLVAHTSEQLRGQSVTTLLIPGTQETVATSYGAFVSSDAAYYSQTWHLEKGVVLTLLTSRLADGALFLNVVSQVTDTAMPELDDLPIFTESRAQDRRHLSALYEAIPDGVIRFDRQGICLAARPPTNFQTAIDYDDIIGKSISYGMPQVDAARDQKVLAKLFDTGKCQIFENRLLVAGKVAYRQSCFVKLSDDEGLVVIRDITAQRYAEQARDHQYNQLQALYALLPDGVLRFDRQGICLEVKAPTNFTSYKTYVDTIGKPIYTYLPQADADQVQAAIDRLFTTGDIQTFEHSLEIDGDLQHRENRFVKLGDNEGIALVRDITERKRAEAMLATWKHRYDLIVASSGQVVYEYDIATKNIVWSRSVQDVVGFDMEDMAGGLARWVQLIHPDDAATALAALNQAEADATPYYVEYRFQNVLGNYIDVLDKGFFVTNTQGKAVTMLGMMQDISERKQAERALETERIHLRALYEAIPDGIIHFDRQGICLNIKAPAMFEPNRDIRGMIGRPSEEDLPPVLAEQIRDCREKLFETGELQHFEYSLEIDGTTHYRENDIVKLNNNEGLAVIRDITDRKQHEQENKAQKEHLLALYQALPDAIIHVDQAGNYLDFKPSLEFQPLYSVAQTVGHNIRDNVPAEVAELAMHYLERLFLTGKLQRYEHSLVVSGEVRYRENRLVKLNDTNALIIVRDITDQKRAETAAKVQQEQLVGLYQAFPDTVIRFDRSGYCLDVKPPSQVGSYYVASEFAGRHIRDNMPADVASTAMQCIEQLFTTSDLQHFEYSLTAAGTTYFRETRLVKLNTTEGLMIVRDITGRKRSEQSIQAQQARLLALYEAIPDGIAQVSRDGLLIDMNTPTVYQPYRADAPRQGSPVRDNAPPHVVEVFEAKLEHLFVTGESQKFEYNLVVADQTCYRECRLVKLNDDEALSIVRDITEQTQAELAFREGQARLLALYEGIPDIVTWFKRDGTIVDYTKLHEHDVYNPEAPRIGHNIMSIVAPHIQERFETSLERLFATKQMQQFDYSIELLGQLHYRECRFILRGDDDVLLMTRDITEQKQAELAFHEGQARLLALYQGIPDAITWFTHDGTIVDYKKPLHHEVYNPGVSRLGQNIRKILPPHIKEVFELGLERLFASKEMQQFNYNLELAGETHYRECRLILRNDDDVLVMVRDITEQKRTEQDSIVGQARLLALYQGIPDAITWFKRDGTILDLKPPHTYAPTHTVDDIVGRNMREFAPADVVVKFEVALEALFQQGNLQQFEYTLELDGELRARECRLIKLNDDEALSMVRDITEQKRTQVEAQTGQERILALYEGIPDALTWITREGVILDHKISLTHQTYKLEETVVGKNIRNFAPESAKDALENSLLQLFDHGKLQQFNYSFMKDGITFYRECQLVKRNHDEALVIVRDISAYKRVEDALRIEKEQVLALYEAIPDGITRLNREGVYLDIKPIQGEGSHKPISELLGHTFEENLPPENALIARRYLDRLFQTGQMQRFEAHIEVNGQMRYRETRLVKLNDQEAFALLRDITQQEQIAQHLNNERAHLLALYEAIPDAIIRVSREGQYLSHKPAMYFEPYMSPDATLGQYVHDNTPSDVSKRAYQYLQRLFDTGEMQEFENTLLISGEVRHRENRLVKLNDDEAIVIVRDITSRKRTEEALKTEKEQVLAFYEAIPDGIVRLNRAGIYLDIKPIQAQGTYKPLADLLRHSFDDNLPADIALIAKRHTERLFQTGESQLFAAYMEVAGQLRYRETRMVKLNDNEAIAIVRDLTEQRQAEQALEESKQRLDLAIEAAELGIWDRYANAEEAVVNSHYRRILGLSETSPTQLQAILDDIHPDDVDLVMSDVSGLYDGSKHRISHERRQRHGDGSYRWLRVTGTTVEVDEEAKPLRFVMVIQDIHVQKTLQLQLEATLRELEQTLKEKTVLLAEVHHRVKNNMQIIGSIMSLHAREANQPEAKAALMSSRTRIRTMATIHEVMYNTEVFSDLDFSAYLQTIAQSLVQFSYRDTPSQVGERRQPPELEFKLIPVRLDMQDALPCALIFNELLSNALKHAFPVARATYTSAAPKIYISLNQVGERISLSIRDNGVGVTTTRKNFGSFIVDTLVEQLGGKLELTPAYQDPPEGTQAMLTFDKMTP